MSAMYASRLVGVRSAMPYMPACRVVCRPGCLALMCEPVRAFGRRDRPTKGSDAVARSVSSDLSQPAPARSVRTPLVESVVVFCAPPRRGPVSCICIARSFPVLYFGRNHLYRTFFLTRASRIGFVMRYAVTLTALRNERNRSFSICQQSHTVGQRTKIRPASGQRLDPSRTGEPWTKRSLHPARLRSSFKRATSLPERGAGMAPPMLNAPEAELRSCKGACQPLRAS